MRVIFEFIMMALWTASFITMLLPKGKDFRLLFNKPPYVEWDVAVALAALEVHVPQSSNARRFRIWVLWLKRLQNLFHLVDGVGASGEVPLSR